MHHLVDDKGRRLFPPKMRLLEHWNLRDEIKADYSDKEDGLPKQRDDPAGDGAHRRLSRSRRGRRQPARRLESVHERSQRLPTVNDAEARRRRAPAAANAPSPTRATR